MPILPVTGQIKNYEIHFTHSHSSGEYLFDIYSVTLDKDSEIQVIADTWTLSQSYLQVYVYKGIPEDKAISEFTEHPWKSNFITFYIEKQNKIGTNEENLIWTTDQYVFIFRIYGSGVENGIVSVEFRFNEINPYTIYAAVLLPLLLILYLEKKHKSFV